MFATSKHKATKENQSSNFDKRAEDSINAFASQQNKFNTSPFDFSQFPLQAKLKINAPGDRYEQEADRIADKVVNMNDVGGIEERGNSKIQMKSLSEEISSISGLTTQRKCTKCEEEEEARIQRKSINSQGVTATSSFNTQLNATKGRGSSMDASTNQYMSSRFGVDFNHVNIHADDKAAAMSQSVNARAFTLGNDIYFNKGEFKPQSSDGKRLLAHELVHTVQQNNLTEDNIQRAVWICDDWSMSSSGSYRPGPGISFGWSGDAITISANFELFGSAASSRLATQMKSTIESYWTGTFGRYTVSTTVNITVRSPGASGDSSRTQINCISEKGVSNVMPEYWIVGSRMMNYYTSSDINWTPAHEFGHLLGLGDRYSENNIGQIFGAERASEPDRGWGGNIMAAHMGVVESKNIRELMGCYAMECTSSHLESPL